MRSQFFEDEPGLAWTTFEAQYEHEPCVRNVPWQQQLRLGDEGGGHSSYRSRNHHYMGVEKNSDCDGDSSGAHDDGGESDEICSGDGGEMKNKRMMKLTSKGDP